MKTNILKEKKGVYISVLITVLAFSVIFLNSFYWPYEEISKRKIFVWAVAIGATIIIPILSVKVSALYHFVQNIGQSVLKGFAWLKKNKTRIIWFLVIMFLGIVLSDVVTFIINEKFLKTEYNPKMFETFVALLTLIVAMSFIWKVASERRECVFVIIALIMGIFSISVTPNRVGISWDDEVHYRKTLEISNVLNGITYLADERNIGEYANNIYGSVGYDRESAIQYENELSISYEEYNDWTSRQFVEYGVWSVAYVPAAVGIMLARGLGLSYINVFNTGRLINLIGYVLLIYLSMKRIKHGKMIIATIGLIPTSVFMAASYSYDWWVTGFTILGFSYFFAELQEESKLSNKNMFIILGALLLGCLPKAIYFPILFPLLFMPRAKFKNSKQQKWYYVLIVGVGVLLVASFLLPRFIHGIGTGDERGGTEVNSTNQVMYILQNPADYAKTLIDFLKFYISPPNTGPMLQRLAYIGEGEFYGVVSVLLPVVAFLDRGDACKRNYVVRCAGIIGCAVALVLATTALYISFTSVGADTVAGMQGRYMVPFIFPTLYCFGVGGTQHKINKNAFVCLPMIIISLTFIYNMFTLCVLRY